MYSLTLHRCLPWYTQPYITLCPTGLTQAPTVDPWSRVLAAIAVPELNPQDLYTVCLAGGGFLFLYSQILLPLPLCQTLAEEMGLIERLLDWTGKAKPR